jgi:hypothetical protein
MEGLQEVQPRGLMAALAHERQTWRSHHNSGHSALYGDISKGSTCIRVAEKNVNLDIKVRKILQI